MVYNFFDRIFCITLEGQIERQQAMTLFFEKLGINNIEYFIAKRHPRGGLVGCFDSHYQVCKICKDNNYKNVLIFEDDVITTPAYSISKIVEMVDFMKIDKTWEYFALGYGPHYDNNSLIKVSILNIFNAPKINKHIINYTGTTTHAYCLSERGINKVLQNAPIEMSNIDVMHYDVWLFTKILNPKKCYASIPLLFDQIWCFATTNKYDKFDEYVTRQFTCNMSKMNTLYYWSLVAYYKNICIYIIFLLILYISFVMIILDNFFT